LDKLTKEEWADWFMQPGTIQFFEEIRNAREEVLEQLANGLWSENPGRQNLSVGLIAGFTKILKTEYFEETHGE
jgi:hypothetical protein